LPEWLTELRETLTYLYQLTKGHDKSTHAQPDEEISRVKSGRVLNIGASVPVGLEGITLPEWMCLLTWKLSESPTTGILWRLPLVALINY